MIKQSRIQNHKINLKMLFVYLCFIKLKIIRQFFMTKIKYKLEQKK